MIRRYSASRCASLGGRRRIEILQVDVLTGEQGARLELEQGRDEDEELAAGLEVELFPLGKPFHERQDHASHVHFGQVELVAQDEREQQVEGPRTPRGRARAPEQAPAPAGT